MELDVRGGDALSEPSPFAVIAVGEGASLPDPVAALFAPEDFGGKAKQTLLLYPGDAVAADRLLLVGLGPAGDVDADDLRQAAATAVRAARDRQAAGLTFGVHGQLPVDGVTAGRAIAEGFELGAYRFWRYRTNLSDEQKFEVETATVLAGDGVEELAEGVALGAAMARGVTMVRDLVNTPPGDMTPPRLADEAVRLGDRLGLPVTVLDKQQLVDQGFGGVLAVGKGSSNDPRFLVIEYGADLDGVPTVCLVGKGITFDSGGLSIKPADAMETMKNDMAGAAAVLGTVQVAAELEVPVHVVGIICAAENMPSGDAYRPGDVVTTLSGKTIEILNTDAEGRVVLSDGLFYAQRHQPDAIICLATLTGAAVIALGRYATGLMATDQGLADRIIAAGVAGGDRVWQLPLWDEYREMVKSDIADVKNLAGRPAGAITAGAFLAAFVGDHAFAHLDIAASAWVTKPEKPYEWQGATGAGVRTVAEYLRSLAGA